MFDRAVAPTVTVVDCPGAPKRAIFSASDSPPPGGGASAPARSSTNVRVSCEPSAKCAVTFTGQGLSASPVRDSSVPNPPPVVAVAVVWTSTVIAPPIELGALAQPSTQATGPKCSAGDPSVIVGQSIRVRAPEPITETL